MNSKEEEWQSTINRFIKIYPDLAGFTGDLSRVAVYQLPLLFVSLQTVRGKNDKTFKMSSFR